MLRSKIDHKRLPQSNIPPYIRGRSQLILQLMLLPAIIIVFVVSYLPMGGIVVAFKDYNIFKGIAGSPWASHYGFEHFVDFFSTESYGRIIGNTIIIALLKLAFCTFPPVIFAVMLNEVRNRHGLRIVQTISYLPHFISWAIAYGVFYNLLNPSTGALNVLLVKFGVIGKNIDFLGSPEYYRPLIILTDIWKGIGWSSIIYLAAICSIDVSLFEALSIDGGNRYHKFRYIIWPHIRPTFALLFILECGKIMSGGDGFNQAYAFGNASNRYTSDILDTYIMRAGFENGRYSYATAIGLFQSVVNLALLLIANAVSKKISDDSLF